MKSHKPLLIATLCCTAVLAACNKAPDQAAAENAASPVTPVAQTTPAADSGVVAVVNGKTITQADYDSYAKQRALHRPPNSKDPAEERKAVITELVNLELILQDAVAKGIDKKPEVVAELENQRRGLLVNAAVREHVENNPISDEALKKEYDTRIAAQSGSEYKARHILVASEDEAKAVIAELDKGADFTKLANERSTDNSSKDGGDLGWFAPDQMVPPFAEAVKSMEKGTYTKTPVKTDFGWHVILLEDTRQNQPPAFEQVKERVRSFMQNQQVNDYIEKLRTQAKVETRE